MYRNNEKKNSENIEINGSLDNFLSDDKKQQNIECKEDVCYVNDGKEIVERIEKKLVTSDGRRLLI